MNLLPDEQELWQKLQKHGNVDSIITTKLLSRLSDLRTQLAAAQRDRDRLEWVVANRAIVYETSASDPEKVWTCYLNSFPHYHSGFTWRAAIDAAMQESQKEPVPHE